MVTGNSQNSKVKKDKKQTGINLYYFFLITRSRNQKHLSLGIREQFTKTARNQYIAHLENCEMKRYIYTQS